MVGANRKSCHTEFPIFERRQVLLLRIKLLFNKRSEGGEKVITICCQKFSPQTSLPPKTLSITLYFYCKLDPNARTEENLQKINTINNFLFTHGLRYFIERHLKTYQTVTRFCDRKYSGENNNTKALSCDEEEPRKL